jgi:hypothetical protein
MADAVVVNVKPGSRRGPLVEVGSDGEHHPAAGCPPPIAKKPTGIGVRRHIAA